MEEKQPTPEYLKGFNYGYIIGEHKPDLALSLSQTKFPENEYDYGNGLKDGIQQKTLELTKEKFKTKQQDKNLDRGR